MTDAFQPLADQFGGQNARRECLADLTQALDAPPHADSAARFLNRWGEGLRELLPMVDDLISELEDSGDDDAAEGEDEDRPCKS